MERFVEIMVYTVLLVGAYLAWLLLRPYGLPISLSLEAVFLVAAFIVSRYTHSLISTLKANPIGLEANLWASTLAEQIRRCQIWHDNPAWENPANSIVESLLINAPKEEMEDVFRAVIPALDMHGKMKLNTALSDNGWGVSFSVLGNSRAEGETCNLYSPQGDCYTVDYHWYETGDWEEHVSELQGNFAIDPLVIVSCIERVSEKAAAEFSVERKEQHNVQDC